jgi:hypothetical protein
MRAREWSIWKAHISYGVICGILKRGGLLQADLQYSPRNPGPAKLPTLGEPRKYKLFQLFGWPSHPWWKACLYVRQMPKVRHPHLVVLPYRSPGDKGQGTGARTFSRARLAPCIGLYSTTGGLQLGL